MTLDYIVSNIRAVQSRAPFTRTHLLTYLQATLHTVSSERIYLRKYKYSWSKLG